MTQSNIEALRSFDAPTIANAIDALNIRSNTKGSFGREIRCMFPELGVMTGYAVTATLDTTTPGRIHDKAARFRLFEAIRDAPKPVVLVLQDVGSRPRHSCHFGDGNAKICMRLGAVGLVTDGGVRDVEAVRQMGFHYFAPGSVAASGNFGFHEIQVPVELSGVRITPGTLIHADVNGGVVMPSQIAGDVIQRAEIVRQRESELHAWIDSEAFSLEALRQR